MVLDTSLLNTQQYKVCIKGKVEQSRERSSYWCSSYWKGSLWVALDYSRQLYNFIFSNYLMSFGGILYLKTYILEYFVLFHYHLESSFPVFSIA